MNTWILCKIFGINFGKTIANMSFSYFSALTNFSGGKVKKLQILLLYNSRMCFIYVTYVLRVRLNSVCLNFVFQGIICSKKCDICNLTEPTFQRRINVVSTLWIIRRRIFDVAQHWYNVGVWRWNNVETTLIKLYLDVVSTYPHR